MNLIKNKIITIAIFAICISMNLTAQDSDNINSLENTQKSETTEQIENNNDVVTQETTEATIERKNPFLEWFLLGGPFMYGILALSIIALGVILERIVVYKKERLNNLGKYGEEVIRILEKTSSVEKAISYLEGVNCNITRILIKGLQMSEFGIQRVEKTIETQAKIFLSHLENKLNILSAIGTTAPLLGFLGTVAGMINAFQAIANAEQVNAKVVASGIFEALITTEYGLIVAIPVFFITNYFYHRVDTFASEMEKVGEDIINFKLSKGITKLNINN